MEAVLLLNADFSPINIVTKRRAFNLLLKDRADTATDDTHSLRTFTTTWEIPQVIRLRSFIKVPRFGANWSRRGVMNRDNWTCIYCGIQLGNMTRGRVLKKTDFTVDHIIPKSRGGVNRWGNTACACLACNNRKDNKRPEEMNMRLRWEPKIPRVDYIVASGNIPKSWKIYLET